MWMQRQVEDFNVVELPVRNEKVADLLRLADAVQRGHSVQWARSVIDRLYAVLDAQAGYD